MYSDCLLEPCGQLGLDARNGRVGSWQITVSRTVLLICDTGVLDFPATIFPLSTHSGNHLALRCAAITQDHPSLWSSQQARPLYSNWSCFPVLPFLNMQLRWSF
jgi:hypothetical protein